MVVVLALFPTIPLGSRDKSFSMSLFTHFYLLTVEAKEKASFKNIVETVN